jgi:hypothetical protein
MATLSRRERRLLRHIGRGLLDDDPRLAGLLSGPTLASKQPPVHRLTYIWIAMGLLLICGGLALPDMDMVLGGLTVVGALPVVIALVVLVDRTGRR